MPSIADSNAATKQEIRDVAAMTVFAAFAANTATPSVAADGTFKTANTVSTTITNFIGGYDGQRIKVVINDAFTIVDFTASSLIGNGGADWNPVSGDVIDAVYDGTLWFCIVSSASIAGLYIAKDADDTSTGQLILTKSQAGASAPVFQAENTSTDTSVIGIVGKTGTSTSGIGVYGESSGTHGTGVYGQGNGTNGTGIQALALGSAGIGINTNVIGATSKGITAISQSATGINYGLWAENRSPDGFGAYFENSAGTDTEVKIALGSQFLVASVDGIDKLTISDTGVIVADGGIDSLTTATGTVSVAASAAPAIGYQLVATSDALATWQEQSNWIVANGSISFTNAPQALDNRSFAIGDFAVTNGEDTMSLGTGAYAEGQGCMALGTNALAIALAGLLAPNNLALGNGCTAIGDKDALAIGNNAVASEEGTLAVGNFVEARGIGSAAVGNNVFSDIDYEAVFGTENNTLSLVGGALSVDSMYMLNTYTVATLPTVTGIGMIYVSDAVNGSPALSISDGTSWQMKSDNIAINAQTGTTYTLIITDTITLITMNNALANTLTVPLDSVLDFPIGTQILVQQIGVGQTTINGSVTLNSAGGFLALASQYSSATLIKTAADIWSVIGDLA